MKKENIDTENKHVRNQFTAYVGFANNDMGLLGEYETAINIIIKDLKSSKKRVDLVAHPLLYMMRHSLELGYKSNLKYFEQYSGRKTSKKTIESHNLQKLNDEFKTHFDLISSELNFDNDLVVEFELYFNKTTILINEIGSTEASTYRYTKNSKGQRIFELADKKDIGKIKDLYDKAITMLSHTADLISPYTDYKDLIKKNPNFKDGVGTVKMTFPTFQLNSISDSLDKQYEKLDHLKWKNNEDGQQLIIVTIGEQCYLTPTKQL